MQAPKLSSSRLHSQMASHSERGSSVGDQTLSDPPEGMVEIFQFFTECFSRTYEIRRADKTTVVYTVRRRLNPLSSAPHMEIFKTSSSEIAGPGELLATVRFHTFSRETNIDFPKSPGLNTHLIREGVFTRAHRVLLATSDSPGGPVEKRGFIWKGSHQQSSTDGSLKLVDIRGAVCARFRNLEHKSMNRLGRLEVQECNNDTLLDQIVVTCVAMLERERRKGSGAGGGGGGGG